VAKWLPSQIFKAILTNENVLFSKHFLICSREILCVLLRIRQCGPLMAQDKYLFSKMWPEKNNCVDECEKDKYFYLCMGPRETVKIFVHDHVRVY
jgi:hypothetical protein